MTFSLSDIRLFIMTANRPAFCKQALESLLASSKGEPLDIWVLDNSGNDETKEMLRPYPGIHYVKTDVNTSFANLKKMQELMQTPYALTLHDDDLLHPDYLELALQVLNKYPDVSLVGSKQSHFFTAQPPQEYCSRSKLSTAHWLLEDQADFALSFWDKPSLSWSGSIIKSELYKKVLPDVLRQRYGKIFDWPLLVEAMQTGKAVSFCDKNCFFYRIHAQQDTVCDATGVTLEQLVNWEDFFRRYASTKRGLYKIYFRRAITNLLDNWRVFTSSRERAQKTEKELLQYAKSRGLITPGMLFCHQMAQRGITKILTVPFKLYYKRNYYGKMLKRL